MNQQDKTSLVLEYDDGQWTFNRFNPQAGYDELLDLAEALNSFQADKAKRVLLVTTRQY